MKAAHTLAIWSPSPPDIPMSKRKTNVPLASPTHPSSRALKVLLALAVAETALALFQWYELWVLRHGGKALCSINSALDCEVVWNTRAASLIHGTLGVPVAGLGVVWGAAAVFLCVALLRRRGEVEGAQALALRLMAVAGFLSCAGFAAASIMTGTFCPTCLLTYTLVVAFGVVALRGTRLPAVAHEWVGGLLWAVTPAFVAYLAVLWPGISTPRGSLPGKEELAQQVVRPSSSGEDELTLLLLRMSDMELEAMSDMLASYRSAPATPPVTPRQVHGPPDAPMRVVDFTDIRCPHCRQILEALEMIERSVPPGRISVESRQFPLDSTCNAAMKGSDGTGIRCTGAKALICLEGAPDFKALQRKLFEEQTSLSPERIVDIASSGSVSREALRQCLESPETQSKLNADIAYAMRYNPEGTPLVLVNGREAPAAFTFLYALALASGDPDAPAFTRLLPPGRR